MVPDGCRSPTFSSIRHWVRVVVIEIPTAEKVVVVMEIRVVPFQTCKINLVHIVTYLVTGFQCLHSTTQGRLRMIKLSYAHAAHHKYMHMSTNHHLLAAQQELYLVI